MIFDFISDLFKYILKLVRFVLVVGVFGASWVVLVLGIGMNAYYKPERLPEILPTVIIIFVIVNFVLRPKI